MASVLAFAVLAATTLSALAAPEESCAHPDAPSRASLIQIRSKSPEPKFGLAYNVLPIELRDVGISLFGGLDNLKGLLENTQILNTSYAGIPMAIAMDKHDDAAARFGPTAENGEEYGLDSLLQSQPNSEVLNMIDVGGNLGVVTIAVYKKYPGKVRAVVVEPVPTTHFYLRLNLWLNHIPPLPAAPGAHTPGVGAIQKAISTNEGFVLNICIPGHDGQTGSMNAYPITPKRPCNCQAGGKDFCTQVGSTTMQTLFAAFLNEPVHFLKLDCEECEREALVEIQNKQLGNRIVRMAGEMHMMEPSIVDLACQYNGGAFLTGMCQAAGQNRVVGKDLCNKCSSRGTLR